MLQLVELSAPVFKKTTHFKQSRNAKFRQHDFHSDLKWSSHYKTCCFVIWSLWSCASMNDCWWASHTPWSSAWRNPPQSLMFQKRCVTKTQNDVRVANGFAAQFHNGPLYLGFPPSDWLKLFSSCGSVDSHEVIDDCHSNGDLVVEPGFSVNVVQDFVHIYSNLKFPCIYSKLVIHESNLINFLPFKHELGIHHSRFSPFIFLDDVYSSHQLHLIPRIMLC